MTDLPGNGVRGAYITSRATVTVVRPGVLTTFQDLGRPGWAHLAVPCSGALDPAAHARANRLVGNDERAATLETTVDGVALRFDSPTTVAVTGAAAPVLVNGEQRGWSLPLSLREGDVLDVGPAVAGVRSYVAVGGGFDAPRVLGSRSHDLLSGLGPPPLVAGARLHVGGDKGLPAALDMAPYPAPPVVETLLVSPGPREGRLSDEGARLLFEQTYRVSPLSNRIGLRLEGRPLERRLVGELPSEGMVWGSIQLLADGQLVVLLADHPTTGGYPVVGVVDRAGASACAQARPGTHLRLRRVRPRPGTRPLPGGGA
jgi:biotin-dependent carboxylase-like uncharacterized protein